MNQFLLTCFSVFTKNQPQHLSQSTIVYKQKRIKPFLEYLEANGINSFEDFDSSHVYEFMNSLNYSAQTKSSIAFAIRNLFDMFQKQHESAWSVSVSVFEANRFDAIIVKICE